jgi:hypothetical protein
MKFQPLLKNPEVYNTNPINIFQFVGLFILDILITYILIKITSIFFPLVSGSPIGFNEISTVSISLLLVAVVLEEFVFRYFQTKKGIAQILWFIFISLNFSFFYNGFITQNLIFAFSFVAITFTLGSGLYVWYTKKPNLITKHIFEFQWWKIVVSSILFALLHSVNITSKFEFSHILYLLLLFFPAGIMYSLVRIFCRHGFTLTLLLHLFHNLFILLYVSYV